jgi:probable rRNA maturation factor
MLDLSIANNANVKINKKKLFRIVDYVLAKIIKGSGDFEISLVVTDDRTIKKLNNTYRGKNNPTDILAFPGEGKFMGEILIDYQQIKRQAKEYGNTAYQEFIFILIHGLLHLAGMDDDTEKKKKAMISLGEEYLNELKKKKIL